MKATDLISRLQHLVKQYGNQTVFLDVWASGLLEIGEVDVDMDDTGIVIWRKDEEE